MTDRRKPQDDDPTVLEGELVEPSTAVAQAEDHEPAPAPEVDYTAAGVPTFDHVRERIEGRVATAGGAGELDAVMPEVRSLEQQEADRDSAGRDKLAEIRRSMRGGA